jgi:beta-lactamase class A
MSRRSKLNSIETEKILKEFTNERTPKEKNQARLETLIIFLLTLLLIFLASAGREIPKLWQKINRPVTVVSQQFSPTATPTPGLDRERQTIEAMLEPLRGDYGIYYEDLTTGQSFAINGQKVFPTASIIKLPVILALYQEAEAGRIDLDSLYRLKASDKRTGAGSLAYKAEGYEISFRKMVQLMGQQSDNTAFHIVSRILGTEKIQSLIDRLGMKQTDFKEQTTTPADMALFWRQLYKENLVTEKNKQEIFSYLTDSIWEDRISAGLPEGIKSAHKIGTLVGVINDVAIVFAERPYILVVLNENANEIEAKKALPEISRKIYDLHSSR